MAPTFFRVGCSPDHSDALCKVFVLSPNMVGRLNLSVGLAFNGLDMPVDITIVRLGKVANLMSGSVFVDIATTTNDLIRLAAVTFVPAHPSNIEKNDL